MPFAVPDSLGLAILATIWVSVMKALAVVKAVR